MGGGLEMALWRRRRRKKRRIMSWVGTIVEVACAFYYYCILIYFFRSVFDFSASNKIEAITLLIRVLIPYLNYMY
jgi:hypothetical protein